MAAFADMVPKLIIVNIDVRISIGQMNYPTEDDRKRRKPGMRAVLQLYNDHPNARPRKRKMLPVDDILPSPHNSDVSADASGSQVSTDISEYYNLGPVSKHLCIEVEGHIASPDQSHLALPKPYFQGCHSPEGTSQASTRAHPTKTLPPTSIKNCGLTGRSPTQEKTTHDDDDDDTLAVAGHTYTVLEKISSGSTSDVLKVENALSQKFAIKYCKLERDPTGSKHSFLQAEISLLERLQWSDRIIKLFGHEIKQECMLLVLELGLTDFATILQAQFSHKLNLEFIRYYTREIFECVQVIHDEGIVHCDIKPGNFIFTATGLKLIDFGISRVIPEYTQHISYSDYHGTVFYSAPEVFRASLSSVKSGIGRPSDIWSCGCILFLSVYKTLPFSKLEQAEFVQGMVEGSVEAKLPDETPKGESVPKSLESLIRCCLDRDASKRPTANQVLNSKFLART